MEQVKYKLTSSQGKGYLIIAYRDGLLNSILIEFKQALTPNQWFYITNLVAPELKDLNESAFAKAGLAVLQMPQEDDPLPGNERVAIFCEYYEKLHGIKYKVTRAAGAKMKSLPLTGNEFAMCIKTYFESKEWYLTPKSIENFCGKINEIRQLISAPITVKISKKYPIPYQAAAAQGLSVGELQEYWKLLREAGYIFQKDLKGKSGIWVKDTSIKI